MRCVLLPLFVLVTELLIISCHNMILILFSTYRNRFWTILYLSLAFGCRLYPGSKMTFPLSSLRMLSHFSRDWCKELPPTFFPFVLLGSSCIPCMRLLLLILWVFEFSLILTPLSFSVVVSTATIAAYDFSNWSHLVSVAFPIVSSTKSVSRLSIIFSFPLTSKLSIF